MVTVQLSSPNGRGEVTVTITDGPDHDVTDVEEYVVPEDALDDDLADQGLRRGTRIGERTWMLVEN